MTNGQILDRYFSRYPKISVLLYGAIVIGAGLIVVFSLTDVIERYTALSGSQEMLARLNAVRFPSSTEPNVSAPGKTGSVLLEGQSLTVANAALLQRITSAITRATGTVISSEVEPQSSQPAQGDVKITVTCELQQENLQQLLYDIEAGMPFLFIDQLIINAPVAPAAGSTRLRVLLGVSGLWRASK
jgi:general secretion pathway protein M